MRRGDDDTSPAAIDHALGVMAGLISTHGRTAALPIFARLEREAAARDDVAALMARARARAARGRSAGG